MNLVFEAAIELQSVCDDHGWRYCFIGGVAVQRWGEPRLTNDADMTLVTGLGNEEEYVHALVARFEARIADAADFALRNRVVLIRATNSTPLDVALGWLDFEERTIERSSLWGVGQDNRLRTCSAEDLVVHKAFAGRPHDWVDIQGIIDRQTADLDTGLILEEVVPLLELKEELAAADRLRLMFGGGSTPSLPRR